MTRGTLFLFSLTVVLVLNACVPAPTQPTSVHEDVADLVQTFVAQTLTAYAESVPTSTSTPPPLPTETVTSTPTLIFLENLPTESPVPTARPAYSCDIINQRPFDDTKFRPNDDFDIRWTIVNNGTQTWEDKTYLEYQTGPRMTDVKKIALPKLKPGEQQEIILDAVAPSEQDMQIMVWVVKGPGKVKDSMYWMCYPYVRIIVER
jgi:hypothetical protein